jgi:MinD-like ATPase involved in chromosome partitioning or flagellar assembly
MMGDQADGLRRLFAAPAMQLTVAAREADVIDAYAKIKHIARVQQCSRFRIAITHARSAAEAQALFDNMCRVAQEYLGVRLEFAGMQAADAGNGRSAERSVAKRQGRANTVI